MLIVIDIIYGGCYTDIGVNCICKICLHCVKLYEACGCSYRFMLYLFDDQHYEEIVYMMFIWME